MLSYGKHKLEVEMRLVAAILLAGALSGLPRIAQAADNQFKDGFELGKFFTSSSMLALEIEAIQTLASEFGLNSLEPSQLAGDEYADEPAGLSIVQAYAIWRLHGLIIPLCEGGLQQGALDPKVLGSLAGNAELVLADIYLAAQEFAANEETSGLAKFARQAKAQDFVNRLLRLAKGAKLKATSPEGTTGQETVPNG